MNRRLRSEAGVTLMELIVAMTIAMGTLLAAFTLMDTSVKQSNAVAGRVNATQRARLAMDTITRQLRSQVCYSPTIPALISATDTAVKFHADLSDGKTPIDQREIFYDATKKTITERTWAGNVGTSPLTFATNPRTRNVLSEVVQRVSPDPTAIFRYYAYDTPPITVPPTAPRPNVLLSTPLSAYDLARVAKIDIGFTTLPPKGSTASKAGVTLQNEIYVRVADPNDPAPTPTCV